MNELIIKQSWNEVTIGDFQEILKVVDLAKQIDMDDFKIQIDYNVKLLTILSNIKDMDYFYDMTVDELNKCSEKLSFLSDNPIPSEIKKNYEIAGYKFNIVNTIQRLTKASIRELRAIQYIDLLYIHSLKEESAQCELLHKELSILMIPEGKVYGTDAFDIEESQDIIQNNMNICDALAVSAFFLTLFQTLTTIIESSLEKKLMKQIKKIKDLEKKMVLMERMKNLDKYKFQMNSQSSGDGSTILKKSLN